MEAYYFELKLTLMEKEEEEEIWNGSRSFWTLACNIRKRDEHVQDHEALNARKELDQMNRKMLNLKTCGSCVGYFVSS